MDLWTFVGTNAEATARNATRTTRANISTVWWLHSGINLLQYGPPCGRRSIDKNRVPTEQKSWRKILGKNQKTHTVTGCKKNIQPECRNQPCWLGYGTSDFDRTYVVMLWSTSIILSLGMKYLGNTKIQRLHYSYSLCAVFIDRPTSISRKYSSAMKCLKYIVDGNLVPSANAS